MNKSIYLNKIKNELFKFILNLLMVIIASTILFFSLNKLLIQHYEFISNANNVFSVEGVNAQNFAQLNDRIEAYGSYKDIVIIDYCIDEINNIYYRKYYTQTISKIINLNEKYPQIILSDEYRNEYQAKNTISIDEKSYAIVGFNSSKKSYINLVNNENTTINSFSIEYAGFNSKEELYNEKVKLEEYFDDALIFEPSYVMGGIFQGDYIRNFNTIIILASLMIMISLPYFINLNKENKVLRIIGIPSKRIFATNFLFHIFIMVLVLVISVIVNLIIDYEGVIQFFKQYFLLYICTLLINLITIFIKVSMRNKRSLI